MIADTEAERVFFEEFIPRGSDTYVVDYLSFLTEYAMRMTCSRLGFLALDSSTSEQSRHNGGNGHRESNTIATMQGVDAQAHSPSRVLINILLKSNTGRGNHYCVVTSNGLPNRAVNHGELSELIIKSASSLCIRLFDGQTPMAWLGLASDKPQAYSAELVNALSMRLSRGMIGLNRLLLREHARKNGREIYMIGRGSRFLEFEESVKRAAAHNRGSVLIMGERGSGKELAAYALHYFSKRREGPFVSVLAPAIAESLQADELFGHERNSFTGAATARKGKFLAAQGGTLFLDEVGDLPAALQFTLLRVVERGEIQPVGRDLPVSVDVRVVTATNMDPQRLMSEGRLRSDLFDRLNVIALTVPPLRERREDIPLMIRYFLERECKEVSRKEGLGQGLICQSCGNGRVAACAAGDFYDAMQAYDWPGNVRELENIMTRVATMARGEVLKAQHLPAYITRNSRQSARSAGEDLSLDGLIKAHIKKMLAQTGNNESRTARILGIPRSTLRSKMKKLGINNECSGGSSTMTGDPPPAATSH